MKTTLNAVLCLVIGLICSTSYSATTHNFATAMTVETELPPNEPQIFYNFLLWKVKGSCEIISDSAENPITFQMITNKGYLNGVEFKPGESLYLVAQNGQRFELIAESRAKVEVVNLGKSAIKMKCVS
jgi:hypothetical protein